MLPEFNSIWVVDSEFHLKEGSLPTAICAVGMELKTGEMRVWVPGKDLPAPYTAGPRDLMVAYAAQAEGQIILSEGWPEPHHWLDLLTVVRRLNNFHGKPLKISLLDALQFYAIPSIGSAAKNFHRDIAIRGGPFTPEELDGLVEYCKSDVLGTALLFQKLCPHLELRYDLLAGRYTGRAVAKMEFTGVPIDGELYTALQANWSTIRKEIRDTANQHYGVFSPSGSFNMRLFLAYLQRHGISWPRTPTGRLELRDDTFKEMALLHPELELLRQTLKLLSGLRTLKITVGPDCYNRTGLWPYSTRTGRNSPGTSKFIFGTASWLRGLVLPPPGHSLLVLDYSMQEFCIAAALARDAAMSACYASGDPYLHFAVLAGAVPPHATKTTHAAERSLYKTAVLGLLYGIGAPGLGRQLGDIWLAKKLISDFNRIFAGFRIWCNRTVDTVTLHRASLRTPFRWSIHCPPVAAINTRSVNNWQVQGAASDILRIAAISMVEHSLPVCAPIHDAFVLVCPTAQAPAITELAVRIMEDASSAVLRGAICRVEVKLFSEGMRYQDEKGAAMFAYVMEALRKIQANSFI